MSRGFVRQNRLAVVMLVSLAGWSAYLLFQPRPSVQADLSRGWYTDHLSHMNACRAFLFGGVNVWTTPLRAALPPLTPAERAALPQDLSLHAGQPNSESYRLPSSSPMKPVVAAWSTLARPYPPGDLLAVLPAALLYEFTDLSFHAACRLLIWLFVVFAHLAAYWFARAAAARAPLALVAAVLAYAEGLHWALEGFYDVAALIPLALFALAISRKEWLWALLAYSAAAFLHFRAYFFGPWAVIVAVCLLRSAAWRTWGRRQWVVAGATVLLSLASLASFFAVAPALKNYPLDNPMVWTGAWRPLVGMTGVIVCALAVFLWARSWPDVLVTIWIWVMVLNLQQAFAWHALLLLPWLVIRSPWATDSRTGVADVARFGVVVALATQVFRNPLIPSWLQLLP